MVKGRFLPSNYLRELVERVTLVDLDGEVVVVLEGELGELVVVLVTPEPVVRVTPLPVVDGELVEGTPVVLVTPLALVVFGIVL
jgi:hypothetical protein